MHIVLPKKQSCGGFSGFGLFDNNCDYIVSVSIPKFVHNFKFNLNKTLERSFPKLFDEDECKSLALTTTSDVDLHISKILQRTRIEVKEEGVKAHAVTIVEEEEETECDDDDEPRYISFNADHPFCYYILNRDTNDILFYGFYVNPNI